MFFLEFCDWQNPLKGTPMIGPKLFRYEVEIKLEEAIRLLSVDEVTFSLKEGLLKVQAGRIDNGLTLPIEESARRTFLEFFSSDNGDTLITFLPLIIPIRIIGPDRYAGFLAYEVSTPYRCHQGDGEEMTPVRQVVFPNSCGFEIG